MTARKSNKLRKFNLTLGRMVARLSFDGTTPWFITFYNTIILKLMESLRDKKFFSQVSGDLF